MLYYLKQCAVLSRYRHAQLFCDPVDCSPPGSSVHGILQVRILEWAAMPSSRGSSPPRDGSCISSLLPTSSVPQERTMKVACV